MFAYDAWANAESLRSVHDAGAPAAAVRLMAHVAAAESLWMGRLRADPTPVVVWPDLAPAAIETGLARLAAQWRALVTALSATELVRSVAYVNSKGEEWTTSVDDILLHVVLHSTHHRGQVAHVLRAAGSTPAYTDYAHCARSGLIHSD